MIKAWHLARVDHIDSLNCLWLKIEGSEDAPLQVLGSASYAVGERVWVQRSDDGSLRIEGVVYQ